MEFHPVAKGAEVATVFYESMQKLNWTNHKIDFDPATSGTYCLGRCCLISIIAVIIIINLM